MDGAEQIPMKIDDAIGMFMPKLSRNDGLQDGLVKKYNQDLVMVMKRDLFNKVRNKKTNSVFAGNVSPMVSSFLESKDLQRIDEFSEFFPAVTEEDRRLALKAIDILSQDDIIKIRDLGTLIINRLHSSIMTYVMKWTLQEKRRLVYSPENKKAKDVWKAANENSQLMRGELLPPDISTAKLKIVNENVTIIRRTTIGYDLMGQRPQ
jgi:hypothetical protein